MVKSPCVTQIPSDPNDGKSIPQKFTKKIPKIQKKNPQKFPQKASPDIVGDAGGRLHRSIGSTRLLQPHRAGQNDTTDVALPLKVEMPNG